MRTYEAVDMVQRFDLVELFARVLRACDGRGEGVGLDV